MVELYSGKIGFKKRSQQKFDSVIVFEFAGK